MSVYLLTLDSCYTSQAHKDSSSSLQSGLVIPIDLTHSVFAHMHSYQWTMRLLSCLYPWHVRLCLPHLFSIRQNGGQKKRNKNLTWTNHFHYFYVLRLRGKKQGWGRDFCGPNGITWLFIILFLFISAEWILLEFGAAHSLPNKVPWRPNCSHVINDHIKNKDVF